MDRRDRHPAVWIAAVFWACVPIGAQAAGDPGSATLAPADPAAVQPAAPAPAELAVPEGAPASPRALVRQGNALLREGKPGEALALYDRAAEHRPDSAELDLDRGLAHFALGDYQSARAAFDRAKLTGDVELHDQAHYALGACDHAEALASQDPQQAMAKLESAMRRYQDILGHAEPGRNDDQLQQSARDAHFHAAKRWREIKQALEQLQQNQQGQDQDEQKQQQDQGQQGQQPGLPDQQDSQNQQQPNAQPESQPQQQQQQGQQGQDEQQQEQQQGQQGNENQRDTLVGNQTEPSSREQALRELRRLIDQQRQRMQQRRMQLPVAPLRPVDKDW